MKITVIGGGGVRSMFLAKSIAQRARELNISQLVFMDINEEKLRIYGTMAKHVANFLCPELDFILTTDKIEAVKNADYIITTIRVGGDEMRVKDERIALNKGVLGQETTGAAGFSYAMRSVGVLVEYCELIKRYSNKNVKVFNFTNPVGVVSQTLHDLGYDFTYGICDAPSGMLHSFAKLYGVSPSSIEGEVYGLNHLSFFNSIKISGNEIMNDLIKNKRAYAETDMRYFEPKLLEQKHCVLNEYLYYFYYREKSVENILKAEKTRGEQICEINKAMTEELSKMDIENDFENCLKVFEKWYGMRENSYMASETGVKRENPWRFYIYDKDAGGYAGVALSYIEILQRGNIESMILCVPNGDAIPELDKDDVIEVTCDVSENGCIPHKFTNIDKENLELIRRVKYYEKMASLAIRTLDKKAALSALTMHPLVNSYSLAEELLEEYIELNKDYITNWRNV